MATPRTPEVDVIRLVALFGICIVNIPIMGMLYDSVSEPVSPAHDQYASFFLSLLFDGKFILLFSFIFGWGIAIQEKRVAASGGNFTGYYFSRAFGLIFLGILHMAFIYGGDILVTYGLMSLVFWFFRGFALRTQVKRFVLLMLGLNYLTIILFTIAVIALFLMMGWDDTEFLEFSNKDLGGSFYEATLQRLREGSFLLSVLFVVFLFQGLAAFGLGYAAEYSGFFREKSAGFLKLQQLWPKLLFLGLLCNFPYALAISELSENGWVWLGALLWFIGAPALSAVYLYFIITVARQIQIPELFLLAGRNSLSVYVLQGLIASLLFGGYGLGLFDQFGDLALIPVCIGIYLVTVVFVGWYAQQFGRGFLEPVLRWISGNPKSGV
ncbi:MAG: DUF418 domain-containing protein [Thiolinea sp.]